MNIQDYRYGATDWGSQFGHSSNLFNRAQHIYEKSRNRAYITQLVSILSGRKASLPSIAERLAGTSIRARRDLGIRTIPLASIVGSENRSNDFDRGFRPMRQNMRARWVGIAVALDEGQPMPAIDVVQIGDRYFVRDGHHRVSVGRAIGQLDIEAHVTLLVLAEEPAFAPECLPDLA